MNRIVCLDEGAARLKEERRKLKTMNILRTTLSLASVFFMVIGSI